MRWPGSWKSPSALALLNGTPINWLLVDKDAGLAPVIEQAKQAGLHVAEIAAPPAGVALLKGEWPGVAMSRGGGTSAGPTGVPWVDTNSWRIRLEAARRPGADIWVDAPPKGPRVFASSYRTAIADAAAYGGRWVISLDAPLAAAIADGKADALATWKGIAGTAAFFAARPQWPAYLPEAVVGVISDFAGEIGNHPHDGFGKIGRPLGARGEEGGSSGNSLPCCQGIRLAIGDGGGQRGIERDDPASTVSSGVGDCRAVGTGEYSRAFGWRIHPDVGAGAARGFEADPPGIGIHPRHAGGTSRCPAAARHGDAGPLPLEEGHAGRRGGDFGNMQPGLFRLFDHGREAGILIDQQPVDGCAIEQGQGGWGFPRARPPHRSPFRVHFVTRIASRGAWGAERNVSIMYWTVWMGWGEKRQNRTDLAGLDGYFERF